MATNSNNLYNNITIINDLADLFSEVEDKPVETFKTNADLLVMSCAGYRLRKKHESAVEGTSDAWRFKTMSITDSSLYRYIIAEDYEMADKIRDHFQKKLLVLTLKGPLSPFRTDLSNFLNSTWQTNDIFTYPINFIGMTYRLPYLYAYDMALQEIFEGDYFTITGPLHVNEEKVLTHIKTVKSYRKQPKIVEYWFKDDKNNRVMVSVEEHNPLISVFDMLVTKPVKISAHFGMRMLDEMQYYNAPVWKYVP